LRPFALREEYPGKSEALSVALYLMRASDGRPFGVTSRQVRMQKLAGSLSPQFPAVEPTRRSSRGTGGLATPTAVFGRDCTNPSIRRSARGFWRNTGTGKLPLGPPAVRSLNGGKVFRRVAEAAKGLAVTVIPAIAKQKTEAQPESDLLRRPDAINCSIAGQLPPAADGPPRNRTVSLLLVSESVSDGAWIRNHL
jgi:hypothetical protein